VTARFVPLRNQDVGASLYCILRAVERLHLANHFRAGRLCASYVWLRVPKREGDDRRLFIDGRVK
jgi:hypothetical protein